MTPDVHECDQKAPSATPQKKQLRPETLPNLGILFKQKLSTGGGRGCPPPKLTAPRHAPTAAAGRQGVATGTPPPP